jgi:hypothetical protein
MVAFAVGGSFVSFHYSEMLWHFFALSMALEHVAMTQAATATARAEGSTEQPSQPVVPVREPEPEFAWD